MRPNFRLSGNTECMYPVPAGSSSSHHSMEKKERWGGWGHSAQRPYLRMRKMKKWGELGTGRVGWRGGDGGLKSRNTA
jgi:hypothetical protein